MPDGEAIVDDSFALAALRHPSVVLERKMVDSTAPDALVDASRSADLWVMGARGKGGFNEFLLGSVSERCIHRAHCPFVIARSDSSDSVDNAIQQHIVVGIDGSESYSW